MQSTTAHGFTLLEVLVALVIVTASSAIILTHISVLMDLNSRVRRQQQEATDLLNQTALLAVIDFQRAKLIIKPPMIEMDAVDGKRIASIENFSDSAKNLPPVDKLYTPYQIYNLKNQHVNISFLLPGLIYGDVSKH